MKSSPHESYVAREGETQSGPITREAPPARSAVEIVALHYDVLRAELPTEPVRHSAKIWNHVDELRVESGSASSLVRNGIRAGVGAAGSWDSIQAILSVAAARTETSRHVLRGDAPLTLELGTLPAAATVFSYDHAGRLSGRTVPPGERLIHIDHLLHPAAFGALELGMLLEIRHDRGAMEWRSVGGIIRQVPAYDRVRFPEVELKVSVGPGEFLVIAPDSRVGHRYLPGGGFLLTERDGMVYETVLCITPHLSRGPLREADGA